MKNFGKKYQKYDTKLLAQEILVVRQKVIKNIFYSYFDLLLKLIAKKKIFYYMHF